MACLIATVTTSLFWRRRPYSGPSSEIGSGYFRETHLQELFRECSHYCELVSSPEQIPQVLPSLCASGVKSRARGRTVKTWR